ncbi:TIGR00153 family protein [Archaeoglobus sulfaticallidus PM70-1]|uniref:TIGR00153 family protein n=1 Tax=Archaeoglobus sulfaticallidus PM70-1 TaxID=387631 RepID=N0BBQ8_9EURY|nr:TIGR00153 family protein [Archaeoglobus sulfaticallidus]AGK60438.1 TIGR00153 family protein [Archaeoglobus sulfaticallidus PM70-1]
MRFIRSITDVFGYSPFKTIHKHSEYCVVAIDHLLDQFEAFVMGDMASVEKIEMEIDTLEHEADKLKAEVRTHVTKSLRLPVDRQDLLTFLAFQDEIINYTEHVCHMFTYKIVENMDKDVEKKLRNLLYKLNEIVCLYEEMIDDMLEWIARSLSKKEIGGILEKVDKIEKTEHECDKVQIALHKKLFNSDMEFLDIILLRNIVIHLGEIANSTARASDSLRTMVLGR